MADVWTYVNDTITRQTDLQRRMYREAAAWLGSGTVGELIA